MNAQRVKEPLAEGTTQNPIFHIFSYQDCHHKLNFLQYVGSHWRCQKRPICRRSTPYMRTTGPVFWRLHPSTLGADILRQAFTPDFVVEACQNSAFNFTWVTPRTARQLFLSPLNLKPCDPMQRLSVHSFGSQERYTIASQVSPESTLLLSHSSPSPCRDKAWT